MSEADRHVVEVCGEATDGQLVGSPVRQGPRHVGGGAFLQARREQFPRERILHVFERVELQASAPDFHGCRYLAVQIELKDQSHPASQVAHWIKANLTAFSVLRPNGAARVIPTCWPGS